MASFLDLAGLTYFKQQLFSKLANASDADCRSASAGAKEHWGDFGGRGTRTQPDTVPHEGRRRLDVLGHQRQGEDRRNGGYGALDGRER